jgi:hypothetical protein
MPNCAMDIIMPKNTTAAVSIQLGIGWSVKISLGRFVKGRDAAKIVRAPFIRPELPSPAIARPMMSIVDD